MRICSNQPTLAERAAAPRAVVARPGETGTAAADDRHYGLVADLIRDDYVVPFLGAGANLCDRPDGVAWGDGAWLPNGSELAQVLADRSRFPDPDASELLRVSQYVDASLGAGQLYRYVHSVFDDDYPPSSLHHLLARVASTLREQGRPLQVIVTTNYDDLLERAFDARDEPYDVVWYEAKKGDSQHRFRHRWPDAKKAKTIAVPNKYTGFALDQRTVILKLHGALDRSPAKDDSFVITEDDYIDYLASRDPASEIPMVLQERMRDSHFLFLGYSLRDWNLRVILSRIWAGQQLDLKSWAIQREPQLPSTVEIEQTLWRDRGDVELCYVTLKEYVERLEAELFGGSGNGAS